MYNTCQHGYYDNNAIIDHKWISCTLLRSDRASKLDGLRLDSYLENSEFPFFSEYAWVADRKTTVFSKK